MEDNNMMRKGRSRRRREENAAVNNIEGSGKKKWMIFAGIAAVIVIVALIGTGYFFSQAKKYETVFFPMTTINGVDASDKDVKTVEAEIADGIKDYKLTITGRGVSEVITKDDIGLRPEFNGVLDEKLSEQDPNQWFSTRNEEKNIEIETMIVYDEDLLREKLDSFSFLKAEEMEEPQNAHISEYDAGSNSYSIVPETAGTVLDAEKAEEMIISSIINLQTETDLEELYTEAPVKSDDTALNEACARANTYVSAVVNHTFGNHTETLKGSDISGFISISGSDVTLQRAGIEAYVKRLAEKYDTAYKPKKLKTSYDGKVVTINGGNYGWKMDQAKEIEAVVSIIASGEQQTREPAWKQKAASHGDNDYGDTYVEINLTAQHLFMYKNGSKIVDAPLVSGNERKGWSTPAGAYPLTYKQRDAILKGETYRTPVDYWMPFNGGIGMHDANWRSDFGGSIYKTSGSHGCINLPEGAAKKIYENAYTGMPVLCYHLAGTESKSTPDPNKPKPTEPPTTPAPTTTAPAPTEPPTTAPAPTESHPAGPGFEVVPAEPGPGAQPAGPGYESAPDASENQGVGPGF